MPTVRRGTQGCSRYLSRGPLTGVAIVAALGILVLSLPWFAAAIAGVAVGAFLFLEGFTGLRGEDEGSRLARPV